MLLWYRNSVNMTQQQQFNWHIARTVSIDTMFNSPSFKLKTKIFPRKVSELPINLNVTAKHYNRIASLHVWYGNDIQTYVVGMYIRSWTFCLRWWVIMKMYITCTYVLYDSRLFSIQQYFSTVFNYTVFRMSHLNEYSIGNYMLLSLSCNEKMKNNKRKKPKEVKQKCKQNQNTTLVRSRYFTTLNCRT